MPRLALLLILAATACGGSETDPHAVGACVGWTDNQGNPFTGQCEAACNMPPASTGNSCDTVKELNCAEFEFDGIDGCCIVDAATVRFYECQ